VPAAATAVAAPPASPIEPPVARSPEISQVRTAPVEEELPAPALPVPPAARVAPAEPAAPVLQHAPRLERREGPAAAGSSSAAPQADVPVTLLRELLGELRRLERARHPPSLSLLRLLAYILQAAAAACLVFGLVSAERMTFLLLTCILLLAALTMLLFERRS
jgi:hypothetical protein